MTKKQISDITENAYLVFVFLAFTFEEIKDAYIKIKIQDLRNEYRFMTVYYMNGSYVCELSTLDKDAFILANEVLQRNTNYMLGELYKYA